ncbi:MAG: hypothetical protein RR769_07015 [Anaerovoracaceae bacterium]
MPALPNRCAVGTAFAPSCFISQSWHSICAKLFHQPELAQHLRPAVSSAKVGTAFAPSCFVSQSWHSICAKLFGQPKYALHYEEGTYEKQNYYRNNVDCFVGDHTM